jgi:hypothetical protein
MRSFTFFFVTVACLGLGACERAAREDASAAGESVPVEIRDAHPLVVSGADTTVLYGPTVFAFFGLRPDADAPSPSTMETAQTFQQELRGAQDVLDGLDVRIVAIQEPPRVYGMPNGADAGSGPALPEGGFGYLFADPQGHVLRVASVLRREDILCTAARTFELTLPPDASPSCN